MSDCRAPIFDHLAGNLHPYAEIEGRNKRWNEFDDYYQTQQIFEIEVPATRKIVVNMNLPTNILSSAQMEEPMIKIPIQESAPVVSTTIDSLVENSNSVAFAQKEDLGEVEVELLWSECGSKVNSH